MPSRVTRKHRSLLQITLSGHWWEDIHKYLCIDAMLELFLINGWSSGSLIIFTEMARILLPANIYVYHMVMCIVFIYFHQWLYIQHTTYITKYWKTDISKISWPESFLDLVSKCGQIFINWKGFFYSGMNGAIHVQVCLRRSTYYFQHSSA